MPLKAMELTSTAIKELTIPADTVIAGYAPPSYDSIPSSSETETRSVSSQASPVASGLESEMDLYHGLDLSIGSTIKVSVARNDMEVQPQIFISEWNRGLGDLVAEHELISLNPNPEPILSCQQGKTEWVCVVCPSTRNSTTTSHSPSSALLTPTATGAGELTVGNDSDTSFRANAPVIVTSKNELESSTLPGADHLRIESVPTDEIRHEGTINVMEKQHSGLSVAEPGEKMVDVLMPRGGELSFSTIFITLMNH